MSPAPGASVADGPPVRREFFARPAAEVAPELLGLVLSHETGDGLVAAVITEVEAYDGAADPASHAFRGPTARNAVMFGEPGRCYVYFVYGMHFCANLVCRPAGQASAVLLRAGQVIEGAELAAARRPRRSARTAGADGGRIAVAGPPAADLARGPARLCRALGIDISLGGADACDPASPLRLTAPAGFTPLPPALIERGPRVGVRHAAQLPWRFWIAGNRAVSAYRPHAPRHAVR